MSEIKPQQEMTLSLPFSIKVYKQYFNFASSHFMIFDNGGREPLHGHNYRVEVKGEAPGLKGDMVFDFLDIKPVVREICDSLDHKLIIPRDNPHLKIHTDHKNYVITTPDESIFSIPQSDVLLLPVLNTSAERLAVHISDEIRRIVKDRFQFAFRSLEVEVEETPGNQQSTSIGRRHDFSEMEGGTSLEGNHIQVYKTDIKAPKYLYLIGGVHGDEVEGVYVLKELFQWLKMEHSLKDLPMIVIPILNVDGYRTQTRVNAHSIDLNRNLPTKDWSPTFTKPRYNPGTKPLSEPENQFLVKLLDKYRPGLIISFHTWKPILNYNGDCKDVADFMAEYNKYEVASDIGYPTPGSLGTFATEKYQASVLTFECPELKKHRETLKEIWQENEECLKKFFQTDMVKTKLT